MDRTLLTMTPANVVSILIMGSLGYALIVLAGKAYASVKGGS